MSKSKDFAVYVEGLWKNYDQYWKSTTVLHDINLHVPRGIIYGLLGPSGCGKTTLLRCIVGRLEINHGEIIVLGKRPGSLGHEVPGRLVGYMPQETALFIYFTITEMLHYFGRLHNMNRKDILSREGFLLSFLDLPSRTTKVSQLSGGQQRRVSLACALIQQPQLLILDEPTIGADPLLREKIWMHLINISKTSQTTIIMTTHYIEEAIKADRVGIMRAGRMLADDEPSSILNKYNEISLEKVFLKLCLDDQNRIEQQILTNNSDPNIQDQNSSSTSIHLSTNRISQNVLPRNIEQKQLENTRLMRMKRTAADYCIYPRRHKIFALIIKDVTFIKRKIAILLFQFLIPIITISFFCLCIGRDPEHIPMALYNDEAINGFPTGRLSLQLINKISSQQIDFTSFNELDQAINEVKQGNYWGVAAIERNFTQAVENKLLAFDTSPSTVNASSLHLYLDMTDPEVLFTIQVVILNNTLLFLQEILSSYKINPSMAASPVIIENPIYKDKAPRFLNFAVSGMMLLIIFMLASSLTALMLVMEKKQGLLERGWIASMTTIELMLSHIIIKFFIQIVQIPLLFYFVTFVFKIETKGSMLLAMALIFTQGVCGMSYGLLISSVCENEIEVIEIVLGTIFPMLLNSGALWSAEGMPTVMRFISNFNPLTHVAQAMRCIVYRGWSFMHFQVWFAFVISSAWTLAFFLLATILFSLRK